MMEIVDSLPVENSNNYVALHGALVRILEQMANCDIEEPRKRAEAILSIIADKK